MEKMEKKTEKDLLEKIEMMEKLIGKKRIIIQQMEDLRRDILALCNSNVIMEYLSLYGRGFWLNSHPTGIDGPSITNKKKETDK